MALYVDLVPSLHELSKCPGVRKSPFMLDLHYQPIQQISVWQNFSLFVMLSFYVKHKAAFFCIIVTANTAFKAAFLMNSSHVDVMKVGRSALAGVGTWL